MANRRPEPIWTRGIHRPWLLFSFRAPARLVISKRGHASIWSAMTPVSAPWTNNRLWTSAFGLVTIERLGRTARVQLAPIRRGARCLERRTKNRAISVQWAEERERKTRSHRPKMVSGGVRQKDLITFSREMRSSSAASRIIVLMTRRRQAGARPRCSTYQPTGLRR